MPKWKRAVLGVSKAWRWWRWLGMCHKLEKVQSDWGVECQSQRSKMGSFRGRWSQTWRASHILCVRDLISSKPQGKQLLGFKYWMFVCDYICILQDAFREQHGEGLGNKKGSDLYAKARSWQWKMAAWLGLRQWQWECRHVDSSGRWLRCRSNESWPLIGGEGGEHQWDKWKQMLPSSWLRNYVEGGTL